MTICSRRTLPVYAVVAVLALAWGTATGVALPEEDDPSLRALISAPLEPPAPGAGIPSSASSPGHIDARGLIRVPVAPYPQTLAADKIAFTSDPVVGLVIAVSGADVHDQWTWRYYWPGGFFPVVNC